MATLIQKQEVAVAKLRRSNRSKTQLTSCPEDQISNGKNVTREYSLNRRNALQKKIDNCNSKHIDINFKPGNNVIIAFSSAAYELFRVEMKEKLNSPQFTFNYNVTHEAIFDEQRHIVEDKYKIHKKKMDGTSGKISKCTINSYRTTSKILVNGSEINIILQHILPDIQEYINKCSDVLDVANTGMAETMKMIEKNRNQTSEITVSTELVKTSDETSSQVQPVKQDTLMQDDIDICLCPICKEESQENTIACDECNEWFHYSCLKLSTMEVNKMDPDTPYICDLCSYELIFENKDKSSEDTSYTQLPITMYSPIQNSERKSDTNLMADQEQKNENNTSSDLQINANNENDNNTILITSNHANDDLTSQNISQKAIQQVQTSEESAKSTSVQKEQVKQHSVNQTIIIQTEETFPKQIEVNNTHTEEVMASITKINQVNKENTKPSQRKSSKNINQKNEGNKTVYITSLEQRIKQQDQTIDLLKRNMELLQNKDPNEYDRNTTEDPYPCKCKNSDTGQMRREIESQLRQEMQTQMLEMRVKQVEQQMIQFMCLNNAITSQMMLQSQKGGTHFINDNNHYAKKDNPLDQIHQMWNSQQTEEQKQFQETSHLSGQEHYRYMNNFHHDHHHIPKTYYNSNRKYQVGNINVESEKNYNSSIPDQLNNKDNRPHLISQRNIPEYEHQMTNRECHLNAHQDHQIRHTHEYNHTERMVHRKHSNDIPNQTTGRAEAHKNAHLHNYHQPHQVQGHVNNQLYQGAKMHHIQPYPLQIHSQESLNMVKKNVPFQDEQHQYSQPQNYVHQIENNPVGTCQPTNFHQMVSNPDSQLPTRSMEHQNRHRANATCDSRSIPYRKFLLPPPYSQIQSNLKPSHSSPEVDRQQTIPQQQKSNIPEQKITIGSNEKNRMHLPSSFLEMRGTPIPPDINQEEIQIGRTNRQC
ncbi:putative uncharacterized protein DDB_G0268364 [Mytilus edulis]|uniref:putative uncharacterized protein DDB_G0268364 n=1 Tax=Mytilus edulis TaxID=6550 RepID=UPI0039EF0751